MKALEILKNERDILELYSGKKPDSMKNRISQIQEAIEELEAIQKCNDETMDEYRRCREINHNLQDQLEALQDQYNKLYYKTACIIDNATSGRCSKPETDLDVIYSLISDSINDNVEYCTSDLEEYIEALQVPKTCNGCIHAEHDEEDGSYTYHHGSKECSQCFRSGWADNYTKDNQ